MPKVNWADPEAWDSKGKPFEQPDFKPVSRRNSQSKIIQQRNALDARALKDSKGLFGNSNPNIIARHASGNKAPPLPLDTTRDIYEDSVLSSALSDAAYNAGYARGNIVKYIEESEARAKAGKDWDRIDRQIRSEEELMLLRNEFMVLRGQRLNLPWWDPMMFPIDGTAVFFGRRRSGKSWMVRHLIYQYRHFYRAVICLTNTKQNAWWAKHIPSRFIHQYSQFVIAKIIEHQRAVIAWNQLYADQPEKLINPYIAIILDDVVSHNMHHDEQLNQLFYEGRHNCMAIFITTQHPKALPPGVRANADVAVIYPQWSTHDQDAIREQYCNFFEHKEDFYFALQEYTQDRECIIIYLGDPTIKAIDSLYCYKADDPGPFITGSIEFWEDDDKYRRQYLELQAKMLTAHSDGNDYTGADSGPIGSHWLFDDSEEVAMIDFLTFNG